MSKSVVMHYVRYGRRGELYYDTVEKALESGIGHIEHELGIPLDIMKDGVVIYTEEQINAKWSEWAKEH